jgi:amidase
MVTIPTGVNLWGMPFGLGILHTAWSERLFIKWASAIEALVRGRRAPTWYNYDAKNILIWDEHEMS